MRIKAVLSISVILLIVVFLFSSNQPSLNLDYIENGGSSCSVLEKDFISNAELVEFYSGSMSAELSYNSSSRMLESEISRSRYFNLECREAEKEGENVSNIYCEGGSGFAVGRFKYTETQDGEVVESKNLELEKFGFNQDTLSINSASCSVR